MKINYKAIWMKIGNAFATPYEERTEEQKDMTAYGLCDAFSYLDDTSGDICELTDIMGIKTPYWWAIRGWSTIEMRRFTRFPDRERATFSYFMAELGNKGYEELIKGVK